MKKLFAFSIPLAFSTALVFAQAPGPRGMRGMGGGQPNPQMAIQRRVDFLARELDLTDAQKTKAVTIYTDAHNAGQGARTSAQSNRQALSDAVKKNDTASIDTICGTLGTLSGQLLAIESKADAAFYGMLTPDQQTKYNNLSNRRGGGGSGPYGPGGPRGRMD